jgi:hypothetical protein
MFRINIRNTIQKDRLTIKVSRWDLGSVVLDDIGKLIPSGASDDTIVFSRPQRPD